jgi:AraC family transcriptional regulator
MEASDIKAQSGFHSKVIYSFIEKILNVTQTLETGTYLGDNVRCEYRNGIWYNLTVYTPEAISNESWHAHVNPHVTLLLSGGTRERRQQFQFDRKAGDVVFFHAAEPHQNTRTLIGSRNFNLEFASDFFEIYDLQEEYVRKAFHNNPHGLMVLLNTYRELIRYDPFSADSITMAVLSLMDQQRNIRDRTPVWVAMVKDLLHDRWNEQVTLNELSLITSLHPVTISKQFSSYFGCNLGEYMRKLKIAKTLGMLKNKSYSLTHIAHDCGFVDQAHFTRTFKLLTGFLPKEYRQL